MGILGEHLEQVQNKAEQGGRAQCLECHRGTRRMVCTCLLQGVARGEDRGAGQGRWAGDEVIMQMCYWSQQ